MKTRRWTKDDLVKAVGRSKSIRQTLMLLGLKEAGGNYKQIQKYIQYFEIDSSHFLGRGWNKGSKMQGKPRILLEDILVQNSNYQSYKLKKRLFNTDLKKQECEECGWKVMSADGRVPLELHHLNGDSKDNRIENLKILCPNCHSLRPNYRGRNIKKN